MPFHYGDVIWADLDPSKGHEQTKRRPLVVVSNERYNRLCNLSMVVPITSRETGYPLHIDVGLVPGEEGEAPIRGFAEAEQLKALDLAACDICEFFVGELLGLAGSVLPAMVPLRKDDVGRAQTASQKGLRERYGDGRAAIVVYVLGQGAAGAVQGELGDGELGDRVHLRGIPGDAS